MNEWTIMFYVAGDNKLAPVLVSQLKAITDAGFQEDTDVLVHFDPDERGVPTRIYDVNRKRKAKEKTRIGDGKDPFVRTLDGDDVDMEKINAVAKQALRGNRRGPISSDEINAEDALKIFLSFCLKHHRAKRYMLFLIGHGLVVGNDAFLPDDHPVSAITLIKLGEILKDFTQEANRLNGSFELLGLHSCSMSAIEVAYELKGTVDRRTAKYMMASEGPAFVDSWPYRQLLKKIFNDLEEAKEAAQTGKSSGKDLGEPAIDPVIDMLGLAKSLHRLTFYNAIDFLAAGYSHDLALCSLDPNDYIDATKSIETLVAALNKGLNASKGSGSSAAAKPNKGIKELVLLAHLEAQSYFGETYTDLHDFCRCLRKRCDSSNGLKELREACDDVMKDLGTIVKRSRSLGSNVQYSHGLSIYFPWSRPDDELEKGRKHTRKKTYEEYADEDKTTLERYREYAFTTEFRKDNSWLSFLESYFEETRRQDRMKEDKEDGKTARQNPKEPGDLVLTPFGPVSGTSFNSRPLSALAGPDKPDPQVGVACICPSIKNYPREPEEKVSETLRQSQVKR